MSSESIKNNNNNNSKNKSSEQKPSPSITPCLPCSHYQHEFNACSSFKTKVYDYYYGSKSHSHECAHYQRLFLDCVKREQNSSDVSMEATRRLEEYESELVKFLCQKQLSGRGGWTRHFHGNIFIWGAGT